MTYRETVADYLHDVADALYEDPEFEEQFDDLAELRDVSAQYTAEYAYEHSPFYRELMDDHGIAPADIDGIADLEELPVVTGQDIRDNQPPATDSFRLKNEDADLRRPFHTSGTSGNPKNIFQSYDEVDKFYYEAGRRGFEHFGITEDDTLLNYNPFVGLNPSCTFVEGLMEKIGAETIPVSNTPYPLEAEVSIIQNHEPNVMMALPSHADARGKKMQQAGYDPSEFGIEKITLAGEPVSEKRKEQIAETWDAEVYEFFAATESGGIAFECLDGDGLHVVDEFYHVNVVDEDGESLPPGDEGRMVVTNLLYPGEESSMPMLQADLGDFITVYDEDGDCGCDLAGGHKMAAPRRDDWEFVLGAVNLDTLYFEDNIYDHPEFSEAADSYQLALDYDEETGRDQLDVRIQSDDDALAGQEMVDISRQKTADDDSAVAELGDMLLDGHSHLWDTVDNVDAARIDIRVVDEIDTGQGKPERLIDNRE